MIYTKTALSAFILIVLLSGCGGSSWDSIDYSRVGGGYDYDSGYSMPSVFSCTNDDLFACN